MNRRRMRTTRRLTAVAALAAALSGSGAFGIRARDSAAAATNVPGEHHDAAATAPNVPRQQHVSENWAGYVATNPKGSKKFSSVSGSWVQPAVTGSGYSSFWVGIGGTGSSESLEQIGTEANVVDGHVRYSAWYELPPAASVPLDLTINPGDRISATVTVNGTNVIVWLLNQTTGGSFTKTLQMSKPDTSTAEWIAEAPSTKSSTGDYSVLPLADFGTVAFTNATATADGHTGPISDPNWTADEFTLTPARSRSGGPGLGGPTTLSGDAAAGADPSPVSPDGSSFSVTWSGNGNRA